LSTEDRCALADDSPLTPLRRQRRDKLVEAAEALFARNGVRGTTMEQIAEAAGVSKVTVYGYFPDKDAVFAAVGEAVSERILRAVERALAEPAGISQRLARGLMAKHRIVFDLMRASAFAAELFAAKDRMLGQQTAALDEAIRAALAAVIAESDGQKPLAADRARLLFAAADGIANHGTSFTLIAADIDQLCRLMTRDVG
jgi:AcrR family transcriptional regulator